MLYLRPRQGTTARLRAHVQKSIAQKFPILLQYFSALYMPLLHTEVPWWCYSLTPRFVKVVQSDLRNFLQTGKNGAAEISGVTERFRNRSFGIDHLQDWFRSSFQYYFHRDLLTVALISQALSQALRAKNGRPVTIFGVQPVVVAAHLIPS